MGGQVAGIGDEHPCFLGDLAGHGLLQGLPRLDEARQDGETPWGPPGVVAEQSFVPPLTFAVHEHDHRRVGPWVLLGAFLLTHPHVPGRGHPCTGPAARTETVGGVPVGQGDRPGEQSGVAFVEQRTDLSERDRFRRPVGSERFGGTHREVGVPVLGTQKVAFAVGCPIGAGQHQPMGFLGGHQCACLSSRVAPFRSVSGGTAQNQHTSVGGRPRLGQPLVVDPAVTCWVDGGAGQQGGLVDRHGSFQRFGSGTHTRGYVPTRNNREQGLSTS